jgi:hypothetical protein
MKRVTVLLVLLVTMTLALSARKAARTPSATVTVSCSVCTVGEPMTIIGSGFAGRQGVTVYISGPDGASMSEIADKRGDFSVNYPTGLNFPAGSYTVTASESGATATTGFEIQ